MQEEKLEEKLTIWSSGSFHTDNRKAELLKFGRQSGGILMYFYEISLWQLNFWGGVYSVWLHLIEIAHLQLMQKLILKAIRSNLVEKREQAHRKKLR